MTSVRLLGLPPEAHRRAVEHHEALRRECAAVGALTPADWSTAETFTAVLEAVDEAGRVVVVDEELASIAGVLADAVEELEQRCRAYGIVDAVAPPDVQAYRRWLLDEVAGQSGGRPPQEYVGPAGTDDGDLMVEGDLDVFGAEALKHRIDERFDAGQLSVTVDLSRCTFIDSAGMSLLLMTRERCREGGGVFRVVEPTDDIVRLFETVGVSELLLTP